MFMISIIFARTIYIGDLGYFESAKLARVSIGTSPNAMSDISHLISCYVLDYFDGTPSMVKGLSNDRMFACLSSDQTGLQQIREHVPIPRRIFVQQTTFKRQLRQSLILEIFVSLRVSE